MPEGSSEGASADTVAASPPAAPYRFAFATDAILGSRETQEDSRGLLVLGGNEAYEHCIPEQSGGPRTGESTTVVAVVCDGVGGEEAGEVASSSACKAFLDHVDKPGLDWEAKLNGGLRKANDAIGKEIDGHPEREGMATTLVGAVFAPEGLAWVSIGDSLLYRWRAGKLERLNDDHSVRGLQLKRAQRGEITFAEANAYPGNVLVHVLNGQPLSYFERYAGFVAHHDGDIVLVCSDGVKTLADEEIASIITEHANALPTLVKTLLEAVEATTKRRAEEQSRKPRQDNTSIIAIGISAGPGPAPAAQRPPPRIIDTESTIQTAPVGLLQRRGRLGLVAALAMIVPIVAAVVWWLIPASRPVAPVGRSDAPEAIIQTEKTAVATETDAPVAAPAPPGAVAEKPAAPTVGTPPVEVPPVTEAPAPPRPVRQVDPPRPARETAAVPPVQGPAQGDEPSVERPSRPSPTTSPSINERPPLPSGIRQPELHDPGEPSQPEAAPTPATPAPTTPPARADQPPSPSLPQVTSPAQPNAALRPSQPAEPTPGPQLPAAEPETAAPGEFPRAERPPIDPREPQPDHIGEFIRDAEKDRLSGSGGTRQPGSPPGLTQRPSVASRVEAERAPRGFTARPDKLTRRWQWPGTQWPWPQVRAPWQQRDWERYAEKYGPSRIYPYPGNP